MLDRPLTGLNAKRAAKSKRLPVVTTKAETMMIIDALSGVPQLIAKLLYGGGLRLSEGLRLRVKDIDFAQNQMIVRSGKGDKDRRTMLPQAVQPALKEHLRRVNLLHQRDLAQGYGVVYLPNALARKYPSAGRDWIRYACASFRPQPYRPIPARESSVATIIMREPCKKP